MGSTYLIPRFIFGRLSLLRIKPFHRSTIIAFVIIVMCLSIWNGLGRPTRKESATSLCSRTVLETTRQGYFCPCSCSIEDDLAPYGASKVNHRMCSDKSVERHRFLCSLWGNMFDLNASEREHPRRILHIAPEKPLYDYIRSRFPKADYITGNLDITPGAVNTTLVEHVVDVQDIPFPDNFFDMVICNHVLEHVPNDQLAISEFYRVLKTPGVAFLSAPFNSGMPATYENDSLSTPAERLQAYGQGDHLRRYGADFIQRLKAVGFEVEVHRISDYFIKYVLPPSHKFRNREFQSDYSEMFPVSHKIST